MNQKTVRQLKKFARENKVDIQQLKDRWNETPWHDRHAFRLEVTGKVSKVKKVTNKKSTGTKKAS